MNTPLARYMVLTVLLLMLLGTVTGTPADMYANSSEPGFLQNIGPQDDRVDNPLAAVVVAVIVGFVLYRGMARYRRTED